MKIPRHTAGGKYTFFPLAFKDKFVLPPNFVLFITQVKRWRKKGGRFNENAERPKVR